MATVESKSIATLSELLIQRIGNLVVENEEELVKIKGASNIKGSLKGSPYYRPSEQAVGRIKQLKRDLGALLTTSVSDQKDLIKQLDKLDLINNPGELGKTLSKFLKSKEGREVYYKTARDSTVGHHPTALNLLRDALSNKLDYDDAGNIIKGQIYNPKFNQQTREELIGIAKKNKYNLGDSVLAYIDPGSHKEFTTKLNGILGKRGIDPNSKQGQLFIELLQRSAHAKAFGGTKGIPLPPQLLSGTESAEQIFKIAEPYLDLAKAGTAQGLDMHALLRNTDWSNPEDLLKVIQEAKIPNTDAILQRIYKSQVDSGIKPSGRLIGAFTNPELLLKEHRKPWQALRRGIPILDNVGELDYDKLKNLDLTPGLSPGTSKLAQGSTDKIWQNSGIFTYDSAATTALNNPGLLSQSWRAAINNADSSLTNLTKNVFDAEKIFSLQGGYNKLGKGMARNFAWGLPFMYALDKEFREDLHEGDYLSAGNRAVKDYVWGEAIGRGVINPLLKGAKYTYGLLPGAVQSTLSTGAVTVAKSPVVAASALVALEGSFTPAGPKDEMKEYQDYISGNSPVTRKEDEEEEDEI